MYLCGGCAPSFAGTTCRRSSLCAARIPRPFVTLVPLPPLPKPPRLNPPPLRTVGAHTVDGAAGVPAVGGHGQRGRRCKPDQRPCAGATGGGAVGRALGGGGAARLAGPRRWHTTPSFFVGVPGVTLLCAPLGRHRPGAPRPPLVATKRHRVPARSTRWWARHVRPHRRPRGRPTPGGAANRRACLPSARTRPPIPTPSTPRQQHTEVAAAAAPRTRARPRRHVRPIPNSHSVGAAAIAAAGAPSAPSGARAGASAALTSPLAADAAGASLSPAAAGALPPAGAPPGTAAVASAGLSAPVR